MTDATCQAPAASELETTIRALTEGDVITVVFGGQTRTVRVESTDTNVYGFKVYTTSGKVPPRGIPGGVLTITRRGEILFQPTMRTQVKGVTSVTKLGVAN